MKLFVLPLTVSVSLTYGQTTVFEARFSNYSTQYDRQAAGVVKFINTKPNMTVVFQLESGFELFDDGDFIAYEIYAKSIQSQNDCETGTADMFNPYGITEPPEYNSFGMPPASSYDLFAVGDLKAKYGLLQATANGAINFTVTDGTLSLTAGAKNSIAGLAFRIFASASTATLGCANILPVAVNPADNVGSFMDKPTGNSGSLLPNSEQSGAISFTAPSSLIYVCSAAVGYMMNVFF